MFSVGTRVSWGVGLASSGDEAGSTTAAEATGEARMTLAFAQAERGRPGQALAESVVQRPKMTVAAIEKLIATVQARWSAADCDGDYMRWIEAHGA